LTGKINGPTDIDAPEMDSQHLPSSRVFVTGDSRANENVLLITLHTIFVREHNRLCDELKIDYPNASDEELFQKARKIVGGLLQRITFDEWLPALGIRLEPYNGYKSDISPDISNVFSSAAFRFETPVQRYNILRINDQCEDMPEGHMPLRQTFFNPVLIMTSGLDPFIKGMSAQIQQGLDCKVIDDIRNFYVDTSDPGKGVDLAAITINLGRERGLPDYNTIREEIGLGRVRSFGEIGRNVEDREAIRKIYGDVNSIDPWVGMLAEVHVPNAILGETMITIIKDQFVALRDADRFYYEIDPGLTQEDIEEIKNTRFSDVILRNTSLKTIQEDVFVKNQACYTLDIPTNHLELLIYPNPVVTDFDLAIFSYEEGDADMLIINHLGQVVDNQTLGISKGTNSFSINLTGNYPPGVYQIIVELEQRSNAVKFLKFR
jgi:peroxidase